MEETDILDRLNQSWEEEQRRRGFVPGTMEDVHPSVFLAWRENGFRALETPIFVYGEEPEDIIIRQNRDEAEETSIQNNDESAENRDETAETGRVLNKLPMCILMGFASIVLFISIRSIAPPETTEMPLDSKQAVVVPKGMWPYYSNTCIIDHEKRHCCIDPETGEEMCLECVIEEGKQDCGLYPAKAKSEIEASKSTYIELNQSDFNKCGHIRDRGINDAKDLLDALIPFNNELYDFEDKGNQVECNDNHCVDESRRRALILHLEALLTDLKKEKTAEAASIEKDELIED